MLYATFDVEGLYQTFISRGIDVKDFGSCSEIKLINYFNERLIASNSKATFFILASILGKNSNYKKLILDLSSSGHEIASHGYYHKAINRLTTKEIAIELDTSKKILEDVLQKRILGYRAPSFSLNTNNINFYRNLIEYGYKYSSSTYSDGLLVRHGSQFIRNYPVVIQTEIGNIVEVPVNTWGVKRIRFQIGGGLYFRLTPLPLTKFFYRSIQSKSPKNKIVFYSHAYDFESTAHYIEKAPFYLRYLHKVNTQKNSRKFFEILRTFQTSSLTSLLENTE